MTRGDPCHFRKKKEVKNDKGGPLSFLELKEVKNDKWGPLSFSGKKKKLKMTRGDPCHFRMLEKIKMTMDSCHCRKKTFWPSKMYKSRLMSKFNLKRKANNSTYYAKKELICQLIPALSMTFILRRLFNVPALEGRILNADESMTYRWDTEAKSWQI